MVTVLMPGQSDETACVRISAALSEVTKQKLGFQRFHRAGGTHQLLGRAVETDGLPDHAGSVFLTENQPLDVYLNQNCILPLSALLEEHPGLKALFSEQQWASKTYYRRIYAVPARAVSMYQIGFLARADWIRELGARPEKITDLDALHDLLMQVRQRRPNAEGSCRIMDRFSFSGTGSSGRYLWCSDRRKRHHRCQLVCRRCLQQALQNDASVVSGRIDPAECQPAG